MDTRSVTRETGIVIRLARLNIFRFNDEGRLVEEGCELITGAFSSNLEPTPAGNRSVRVHVFRPKEISAPQQAHRAERLAARPPRRQP